MDRIYADGKRDDVDLFVGYEIERTPAFGQRTLFVVGIHPGEKLADVAIRENATHIYLGANHSFDGNDIDKWIPMIKTLLSLQFWVTLDFDVKHAWALSQKFRDMRDIDRLIPVISAKVPNLSVFGKNSCLKIDDIGFDKTNPGVWVHSLDKLLDAPKTFTAWNEYTQDKEVNGYHNVN